MNRFLNCFMASVVLIVLFVSVSSGQISFIKHTVAENFETTMSVRSADLDEDGDIDLFGAGYGDNGIKWWENDGQQNFSEHQISEDFGDARTVYPTDIDGDDDIDVLGASVSQNKISWWENDGDENFTEHIISTDFIGSHTIYAIDMDGDSDVDVLGSAWDDGFSWWENDGNQNFSEQVISTLAPGTSIYAVRGDGNNAELFTARYAGDGGVTWWHSDGTEYFFPLPFSHWAYAADVDSDGDLDVLGASCGRSVVWWENDGSQNFTQHTLTSTFACASSVYADDVDNDGDIDILSTGEGANDVRWWENIDNQEFIEHSIAEGNFRGASDVYTADVDLDGDTDVLCAANVADEIAWWENDLFIFRFLAEPTSGHAPLSVQFSDISRSDLPITFWAWDFNNDDIIDSYEQNPSWTYAESDTYTVRLDISNGLLSKTLIYEDYIRLFNGESALLFDGENSYAYCPTTPSLNLTGALTIEAWINPADWGEGTNGSGRVIDKDRFQLYLVEGGGNLNDHSLVLKCYHASAPLSIVCTPDNSIVLNEWQHIAVTYDGSGNVKIFINGIEQVLNQILTPSGHIADNSDYDLIIGNNSSRNYTFDGVIDEVRLWNIVRSGQEIENNLDRYLSGAEEGLVGYWQLNGANGEIINDSSNNGNDGTIVDAVWVGGALDPSTPVKESISQVTIPQSYVLHSNYPNPFNPKTTIKFDLPYSSQVSLKIYDVSGQLVKILTNKMMEADFHQLIWNGTDGRGQAVSSGMYFYQLNAGSEFSELKSMILLK